jgi:ribosomal protein S27AE
MNNENIQWIERNLSFHTCPRCNNPDVSDRIPRSFFYKYALFWLQFKRYKCPRCFKTFHIKS